MSAWGAGQDAKQSKQYSHQSGKRQCETQKLVNAETVRAFASSFLSSFRRADLGRPKKCTAGIGDSYDMRRQELSNKSQAATALCPSILADCKANQRKAELTNCGTLSNCQSHIKSRTHFLLSDKKNASKQIGVISCLWEVYSKSIAKAYMK